MVFHHQGRNHGVCFPAVDATGFARPRDARRRLLGESFEGRGLRGGRGACLCVTGNR
jgi:hypothetical protein